MIYSPFLEDFKNVLTSMETIFGLMLGEQEILHFFIFFFLNKIEHVSSNNGSGVFVIGFQERGIN